MKRFLVASVFATLPFGGAQAADLSGQYTFVEDAYAAPAPSVVGHLEFALGWWHRQFNDVDVEQDRVRSEARGRINIPFAGNWNLELEAGDVSLFDTDDGDVDSDVSGAVHLWAGWTGFRLGAFGAVDYTNQWIWTGGGEGEIDVGNLTLGLQGSYTDAECPDCDFAYVVGTADFYPMPNTRLGLQGGWGDFVQISDSEWKFWNVGASAEQRFDGTAFSLFARADYESAVDQTLEIYSVSGGFRVFFDEAGMTLQEHDHQVPFAYKPPQITTIFENFD